jgi:ribosomal protein L20
MHGLQRSNVSLNRKVLADLAVTEPLSFLSVLEVVKQAPHAASAAKGTATAAKR